MGEGYLVPPRVISKKTIGLGSADSAMAWGSARCKAVD